MDGPVAADGFAWYLLAAPGLPMGSGCLSPVHTDPYDCPVWWGWTAAYALDGSVWLAPAEFDCPRWPDPYLTNNFVYGLGGLTYLACFGGEERRVVGFYPPIPEGDGLGGACRGVPSALYWLACNLGYEHIVINEADGYASSAFILALHPDVTMPARGQWVEVTGRFDHPAARRCDFEGDGSPPEISITHCRAAFVVTAARPVSR